MVVFQRAGAYRIEQPLRVTYSNVTTDEIMPCMLRNKSDYPLTCLDTTFLDHKTAGGGKPEVTMSMTAADHLSVTQCPLFLISRAVLTDLADNVVDLGQETLAKSCPARNVCVALRRRLSCFGRARVCACVCVGVCVCVCVVQGRGRTYPLTNP